MYINYSAFSLQKYQFLLKMYLSGGVYFCQISDFEKNTRF